MVIFLREFVVYLYRQHHGCWQPGGCQLLEYACLGTSRDKSLSDIILSQVSMVDVDSIAPIAPIWFQDMRITNLT